MAQFPVWGLVLHVDQSDYVYNPSVRSVLNNRTCFLQRQRSYILFSFKFSTSFFIVYTSDGNSWNDTNVHVGQVDCHLCYKNLLHSICDHFFLSFFLNWLSEVALNLPTTQLPFVFPVVCTACRFLTLTKANFVWKHVSKLLFKLVVENKQHKQLIDRTKPDDVHLHVPFQQFLFITILIYTAAF